MNRREFIGGAVAASVAAAFAGTAGKRGDPFFLGVNYGFYARNGYFSSPAARKDVADIAALGAPWVCLIVTVMQAFLQRSAVPQCRAFAAAYDKPFYHGECGCCSVAGGAKLPWYWANGGGYDGREQANYLEAVIRAFEGEPWWHGLLWWKWTEQNDRPGMRDDPAGDKGFTIHGKPAEEVMRRWCASGRSSV